MACRDRLQQAFEGYRVGIAEVVVMDTRLAGGLLAAQKGEGCHFLGGLGIAIELARMRGRKIGVNIDAGTAKSVDHFPQLGRLGGQ